MYDAIRASRVLRPEHAAGEDELHRKEPWPLSDEQRRNCDREWMGNGFVLHFWNDECLLGLDATVLSVRK